MPSPWLVRRRDKSSSNSYCWTATLKLTTAKLVVFLVVAECDSEDVGEIDRSNEGQDDVDSCGRSEGDSEIEDGVDDADGCDSCGRSEGDSEVVPCCKVDGEVDDTCGKGEGDSEIEVVVGLDDGSCECNF